MNFYLKEAESANEIQEIYSMMTNEPGIKKIFSNRIDRLYAANATYLIKLNHETIGFINLVRERVSYMYFLDIGIKEAYRSCGYGKQAYLELKKIYPKIFIIAQTKYDNISANNISQENGTLIAQNDENKTNYYLMDKLKLEQFKTTGLYNNLLNYIDQEKEIQREFVKTFYR
jgi:predicted acetyltransferase